SPIPSYGPNAIIVRPGSITCASATARRSPNARCTRARSIFISAPIRFASAACWSARSARCAGRKKPPTARRARCYRWHPPRRAAAPKRSGLLPVFGQHLLAGPAEPGAMLLQAAQHHRIALVHLGAAEARHVTRAGVVTLL